MEVLFGWQTSTHERYLFVVFQVFQCLMCDDSKESKVTCSVSELANLQMHVQINHPERSEDFNR